MGTVVVGANNYTVYGDLAGAKIYLGAAVGAGPDAWNALATDDLKSKFIVAAYRYLERQVWAGDRTSAIQTQDWPRTGVLDAEGNAVDSAVVPDAIISAEYELAAILAGDSTVNSAVVSGTNTKRLKAGPVEVEYFQSTITSGLATRLPTIVQDLVGAFLDAGGGTRSTVSGDCGDSQFTDCDFYTRSGPFS
jgi:hypothetical protein